jgi:hypothetical protein
VWYPCWLGAQAILEPTPCVNEGRDGWRKLITIEDGHTKSNKGPEPECHKAYHYHATTNPSILSVAPSLSFSVETGLHIGIVNTYVQSVVHVRSQWKRIVLTIFAVYCECSGLACHLNLSSLCRELTKDGCSPRLGLGAVMLACLALKVLRVAAAVSLRFWTIQARLARNPANIITAPLRSGGL